MENRIVEFDLELLKDKHTAVNCATPEQAQQFVDWVCSLGYDNSTDTFWDEYKELICYNLEDNYARCHCKRDWYLRKGYKVISYEEALLKPTKSYEVKGENNMEIEEMIKVMEHFKNGGEVEYNIKGNTLWYPTATPVNYRIAQPKPKTITIEKWVMFDNTSKLYITVETSDISSFERDYVYTKFKLLESYEVQED